MAPFFPPVSNGDGKTSCSVQLKKKIIKIEHKLLRSVSRGCISNSALWNSPQTSKRCHWFERHQSPTHVYRLSRKHYIKGLRHHRPHDSGKYTKKKARSTGSVKRQKESERKNISDRHSIIVQHHQEAYPISIIQGLCQRVNLLLHNLIG